MVKTMTDPVSVSVHLIGGGMDIIWKILTLIDTAIRYNTASCCEEALSALKDTIMRIEPIVKKNQLPMKKHRDKDSAVDNWFEELDGLLCNASQIVVQCTPTGLFSLSYNSKKSLITELIKDIEKHLQLSNLHIMVQNQEILEGQRQIKEALASSSRYADTAKAVHTPIGMIMNSKKVLALLPIGFVLVYLATIPITGRSINLAKSFGPAVGYCQKKSWDDHNGSNLGAQNVANLGVEDAGSLLRKAIADGNAELLKRLLDNGVNPNVEDYNHRTPLHMAAAEGLHLLDRILLDSGSSVFSLDRWGNTPLDEAKKCGSRPLIQILEEAAINASGLVSNECLKDSENKKGAYSFKDLRREISEPTEKIRAKICTVFPFHPWTPIEKRRNGLVMWVPETIEALLQATAQHFGSVGTTVLTEDAGEILFIDLIQHNQKLYIGNLEELR